MDEEMKDNITHMTNKEAADILKNYICQLNIARGNTKTTQLIMYNIALKKAIFVLENTPDETKKNNDDTCSGCIREYSTHIVDHMRYCLYCTRSDPEGGTSDNYDGEF